MRKMSKCHPNLACTNLPSALWCQESEASKSNDDTNNELVVNVSSGEGTGDFSSFINQMQITPQAYEEFELLACREAA